MKILHFADTHLREYGKFEPDQHLHARTIDYLESLDYMIDAIVEEDVDLVVFAGDAFHSHNPNQNILYLFAEKISNIAKHCPIVMVPGNHDMPGPVYKASSIDIFGLEIPNVIVANEYKIYKVDTKVGIAQVGAIPYPMRQHILSESDLKRSKESTWVKYKGEVDKIVLDLSGALQKGMPAILVGHFTISGAIYGSERPMILDQEAEVELVKLVENSPWDYVAMGHIHKHQVLFDDPLAVYAGSLDRIDFSEENDTKGFVIVEIENGKVSYDFVVNIMARPMVTIRIDVLGNIHPMEEILEKMEKYQVADAIVRVIIDCDSILYVDKNEIALRLESMQMYELHGISINVPRLVNSRLESDRAISSYTEEEMLEIFFEEVSDEEYDKLMDLAEEIMGDVNNE